MCIDLNERKRVHYIHIRNRYLNTKMFDEEVNSKLRAACSVSSAETSACRGVAAALLEVSTDPRLKEIIFHFQVSENAT